MRRAALHIVLLLTLAPSALAQLPQPDIELKRTVVKWPWVEVYYAATYGSTVTTKSLTERNFRLYENGMEITDFTVECNTDRDSASVVLVLDGSWPSYGPAGQYGRYGGQRFLYALDSLIDEVAVIGYRDSVSLLQEFTHEYPDVLVAIDSVFYSRAEHEWWKDGGVWDAVDKGVHELANNARNPKKVLVLYSVEDREPCYRGKQDCLTYAMQVIPKAQQNDVHCMVLPYNYFLKPMQQLDSLAYLTGGTLYQKKNGENYYMAEIPPVFEQIAKDIIAGFDECKIVYKSQCSDGTKREIQVELTYP